jgi:hypothetical protein
MHGELDTQQPLTASVTSSRHQSSHALTPSGTTSASLLKTPHPIIRRKKSKHREKTNKNPTNFWIENKNYVTLLQLGGERRKKLRASELAKQKGGDERNKKAKLKQKRGESVKQNQ